MAIAVDATAAEIRVLGCLLEKQRTTPDGYPLTLNALRLACNQATNRDPVVDYDEGTVRDALDRLTRRRWARAASGAGSRAPKFRHLFDETVGLDRGETAVLTVLMLRGAQTPGEIKGRTDRMHGFADIGDLVETLEGLRERELVESVGRRPGEKMERWHHLIGGAEGDQGSTTGIEGGGEELRAPAVVPTPAAVPDDGLAERVRQLEAEVAALRTELTQLRNELGA